MNFIEVSVLLGFVYEGGITSTGCFRLLPETSASQPYPTLLHCLVSVELHE